MKAYATSALAASFCLLQLQSIGHAAVAIDAWQSVAPMQTARYQTAVAADAATNSIYAAGGSTNGNVLASVERYDATTNAWTTLAPMPVAVRGATAAFADGKLYVFSGTSSTGVNTISTVQIYTPGSNSWTSASLARPAWQAAEATVGGKAYLFGGEGPYVSAATVFDPATSSLTNLATPLIPRKQAGAAAIGNTIYYMGGFSTDNITPYATVDSYNVNTNTWSSAPGDLASTRIGFAAAAAPTMLLAAGGSMSYLNEATPYLNSVELFDPAVNAWNAGPNLPIGVRDVSGTYLNGKFYVLGGYGITGTSRAVYSSTVPEPVSLAMLALAPAVLLRRRRIIA